MKDKGEMFRGGKGRDAMGRVEIGRRDGDGTKGVPSSYNNFGRRPEQSWEPTKNTARLCLTAEVMPSLSIQESNPN